MARLIHTMVRVRDLDRSIRFYRDAFGLDVSQRLDFPAFVLVYLSNAEGEAELELTWNRDRKDAYHHGDGYGHVAFSVDDLAATKQRLRELGLSSGDISELRHNGDDVIARYFFVTDPDGYKIEVLERRGRYR